MLVNVMFYKDGVEEELNVEVEVKIGFIWFLIN